MKLAKLLAALLVAITIALPTGCAHRLEQGGAYSQVDQAPDLALFTSDASYKWAYTSIVTVMQLEKDHRAMLATKWPNLKGECDKIRLKTQEIDLRWATARKAYLVNPVPANLDLLNRIAAELQRVNAVAITLIPKNP